jgi:acetylornithine deacetylase/succinyl-diaminopimelate desuccinylase-like protein
MIETSIATIEAYAQRIRPEYERALKEIVEIPTVSTDPGYRDDILKGVDWAMAFLKGHNVEAERFETAGYPVVVGWIRHPEAKKTLTIYNHLDVQPANEPEWITAPFVFEKDGDLYRGRGATDDKGPALAAFYAALAARDAGLPLNIQFIWEFEEEIGSPSFYAFMAAHADKLQTDSVVVSDTIWISRGKPAAPLGLRGMLTFRLLLETGTKDVHSGLAGGAARNPIGELCQLITDMYEPRTGKIKVPGLVAEAVPPTEQEIEGFLASGFDSTEFKRAHGLKCLRTDDPREVTQAIWAKPTFEVHGIVGGYTGAGIKAIVPPRAEAKLSMRLVPDLQPDQVFDRIQAFVAGNNPDVKVEKVGALEPYQGSAEGPYADAVRTSLRFAFGADPSFVREGGSIGAVVTMQRVLGCPIMFIGLSLPEHGYHAPNEHFEWSMAEGGMKAFTRYFELVTAMGR